MLTWLWPCSSASLLTTRVPASRLPAGFAGVVTAAVFWRLLPAVPLGRRKVSVVGRMVSVIRLIGDCRYDGMNSK
ncbi:conserved hypothetical protein [Burkholderia cepacia]